LGADLDAHRITVAGVTDIGFLVNYFYHFSGAFCRTRSATDTSWMIDQDLVRHRDRPGGTILEADSAKIAVGIFVLKHSTPVIVGFDADPRSGRHEHTVMCGGAGLRAELTSNALFL